MILGPMNVYMEFLIANSRTWDLTAMYLVPRLMLEYLPYDCFVNKGQEHQRFMFFQRSLTRGFYYPSW